MHHLSENSCNIPNNLVYFTNAKLDLIQFNDADTLRVMRNLNTNKVHGHDDTVNVTSFVATVVINRKGGTFIYFTEYQHLTGISFNIIVGWNCGSWGSCSALLTGHYHYHQDQEFSSQ